MIRHIVLIKARPDLADGELDEVFADLAALKKVLPGMSAMHAGADISPEGLARGYTHGFAMDFVDSHARDAYLVHPDHIRAGARLRDATQGGRDGILVVDLPL